MSRLELRQELQKITSDVVPPVDYSNVTEIVEKATATSLVLYKLTSSEKSRQLLQQRLKDAAIGCVFLFSDIPIRIPDLKTRLINFSIGDYRKVTALLIKEYYPAAMKIKLAGVTGTNGKSTVVHLCRSLCANVGIGAASIGTLGVFVKDEKYEETVNTTPGPIELASIFHKLSTVENVNYVFMEVSSHALVQERLGPFCLSAAGWTSFGRDHLDYHQTLEAYFDAKMLIQSKLCQSVEQKIVIPEKEHNLGKSLEDRGIPLFKSHCDYLPESAFFKIDYNQNNLSVALGLLKMLGININQQAVKNLNGPKGRFEILPSKYGPSIVDYAHSPDGLESLLSNVVSVFPGKKIGVVFGCGGDRDNGKRPLMGSIAEKYANRVYVTSDNPRTEEPLRIISMIEEGIKDQRKYISEPDRKRAITLAFAELRDKTIDVLVIAGKGHEEYQEIMGVRKYFSDQSEVMELIRKYENT